LPAQARLPAVRLAVGTLTIIPTGAVQVDAAVARRAMIMGPLAVVPLGLVAGAAAWLGQLVGWPPILTGLLVVGVVAAGTRAIHLDGLADTVDGLGSGRAGEEALIIMRRGDVGPMGVVALIVVLGAQAAAIGALVHGWQGALAVAVLICASRSALSVVCARGVPAARSDGLGAAVAGSVPRWAAALTWVVAAVAIAAVSDPWWPGPLVGAASLLGTVGVVAHCVRRLGGVTGDVMGAAIEVCFTILLLGSLR
jgi:adenosylcobinamide-GDP ribazoletransferase